MAIGIRGHGNPRAELVVETGLRQNKEDRWVTSTCPWPWLLRARLLKCSAIHCAQMCFLFKNLSTCECMALPPVSSLSHPLPPPSYWLSVAFLRTWNWMFPLAKTWPCPLKSNHQGEERSDLLEGPIRIQVSFPICGPGRSLGLESEAKGSDGLAVVLGILKNGFLLHLPLKHRNVFSLTPCSCKFPPPSLQCFLGLNFSILHYGGEASTSLGLFTDSAKSPHRQGG